MMKHLLIFALAAAFCIPAFASDGITAEAPEFNPEAAPDGTVGVLADKIRNATFKDFLGLFKVGAKTNFEFDYHLSLPNLEKVTGGKMNLGLNIGTPIGDLVFEYNFNSINWDGKYGGRYFLSHWNFYNFYSVFGWEPFSCMYMPTVTYAQGSSNQMVYRQFNLRVCNVVGYNETAYIFFDPKDRAYTTYRAEKSISIMSLKGLITSFSDFDLFNYAYGGDYSLLNDMLDEMVGKWANFLPMPYVELYMVGSKTEHRYYDHILDKDDTEGLAFGWNLGLMYSHSFAFDIGPGRLILQPRADLALSMVFLPQSFNASLAACYFF